MDKLAHALDVMFNGDLTGPARKSGFVLLLLPFSEIGDGGEGDVLKVPLSYFFEGAPGTGTAAEPSEDGVDTFFVKNDGMRVVRPFNTLPTELQNMMVLLMRTLADQCGR
jgi:hypothetical protein